MRKTTLPGVATMLLALPLSASGQFENPMDLDGPRKPSAWTLAFGAGYSLTNGDSVEGVPFDDLVQASIPLHAELAYRIAPSWALGASFSYGFGRLAGPISDECDAQGIDCRARPVRAGLQLSFSLNPGSRSVIPWVGIGAGFEWLRLSDDAGTTTFRGPELSAQLGLDFPSGSGRWGPYVAATMARYDHVGFDTDAGSGGAEIPSDVQAVHDHLTAGLRLLFDL